MELKKINFTGNFDYTDWDKPIRVMLDHAPGKLIVNMPRGGFHPRCISNCCCFIDSNDVIGEKPKIKTLSKKC